MKGVGGKDSQEAEWTDDGAGRLDGRGTFRRSPGLWLEEDSGANPEMGIWEEIWFGGDTEVSMGAYGYKGPRGHPGGGVQDTGGAQVWGKEETMG